MRRAAKRGGPDREGREGMTQDSPGVGAGTCFQLRQATCRQAPFASRALGVLGSRMKQQGTGVDSQLEPEQSVQYQTVLARHPPCRGQSMADHRMTIVIPHVSAHKKDGRGRDLACGGRPVLPRHFYCAHAHWPSMKWQRRCGVVDFLLLPRGSQPNLLGRAHRRDPSLVHSPGPAAVRFSASPYGHWCVR